MAASGQRSRAGERAFKLTCGAAAILPLALLVVLVADVSIRGAARIDWSFLTSPPSRRASAAGVYPALMGSVYLVALTAALAVPLGVLTAIYLEEYRGRGRFANLIETNIANLAGVPSVIYGLLGLGVFVRFAGMGRSLLAGACTLALLVLPVVILASREALRAVPHTYREAALALGATRWQVVRRVVLPAALPGILTGAILSISRALGETAPLVVVGALTYISFAPEGLDSPFSALPIQIFNWVSRPQAAFSVNAAAAIVVLLVVLLALNALAVVIRQRQQRRAH